jgi:uncharacterized membrane-anchored protein
MKKTLLFFLSLMATGLLYAGDKDSLDMVKAIKLYDSVNKALRFETGIVKLPNGIAALNVPAGFKYLNKEQSKYVYSDLWGNPPREDIEGMIFPANGGPFSDSTYAFLVSYDEMGFVKDEDADKINYDDMIKDMHDAEPEINKERIKDGYSSIHIVGWAQKPFYDKDKKVLHWAKEIHFSTDEGVNTLNYDVRILGRKGVLSLNALATMNELPLVKKDIDQVLHMASFTDGNAYKDFDPGVDKVAAWTIGGLVAGKVLAKVGLFAILGKFLVAGWKFILIGLVAVGGFFKKFFNRKKKQDDIQEYAPAPEEPVAIEEGNTPDTTPGSANEGNHNV